LDNETLARIDYSLKNAKVTVYKQSKSDFVRLALIATHGGIYLDSSYVAITNFDWIINISQYPSQYIFNRFGKHPKVLMQFHPQYGGVFDWSFNKKANTKVQWLLPVENNFIAA
jgi:mannosyltransferase OCH1-like enzyme